MYIQKYIVGFYKKGLNKEFRHSLTHIVFYIFYSTNVLQDFVIDKQGNAVYKLNKAFKYQNSNQKIILFIEIVKLSVLYVYGFF